MTFNFPYEIKRNRRARKIIIKVRPNIVELVLPYGVPKKSGEEFLKLKEKWVNERIEEIKKSTSRYFLFGKEVFPVLENGALKIYEERNEKFKVSEEVTKLFEDYLFRKAKNYIPQRVREIAYLHGFEFNEVRVKRLRSRWGSCSVRKNLSFNYHLIKNSKEVIDYVIVHELCHTKEMNHSKKFWALVEEIIPNYKELKKQLRTQYPV